MGPLANGGNRRRIRLVMIEYDTIGADGISEPVPVGDTGVGVAAALQKRKAVVQHKNERRAGGLGHVAEDLCRPGPPPDQRAAIVDQGIQGRCAQQSPQDRR